MNIEPQKPIIEVPEIETATIEEEPQIEVATTEIKVSSKVKKSI